MSTLQNSVKTAGFTLLVPLLVAGLVPQRILSNGQLVAGWPARGAGAALVVLGIAGYLWCAVLFVAAEGTPAPIAPTARTVMAGPYRINRNPMYTSVLAVVFGQALLYSSMRLFLYGSTLFLLSHLFVVSYEEPTLRKQFDGEYEEFCRRVPRWLPKLRRRR